jgi:hypothetical protein
MKTNQLSNPQKDLLLKSKELADESAVVAEVKLLGLLKVMTEYLNNNKMVLTAERLKRAEILLDMKATADIKAMKKFLELSVQVAEFHKSAHLDEGKKQRQLFFNVSNHVKALVAQQASSISLMVTGNQTQDIGGNFEFVIGEDDDEEEHKVGEEKTGDGDDAQSVFL